MKYWIVMALLLAGCGRSSPGEGPSGQGLDEDSAGKCVSRDVLVRTRICLRENSPRSERLAAEIQRLSVPGREYWPPFRLDFESFRTRHELSAEEISCLKNQFCRGNLE